MTYESFTAYYGGTDIVTLRQYAAECSVKDGSFNDDPERAAMFTRLADEKERGVVFASSTEGGKLHYVRRTA